MRISPFRIVSIMLLLAVMLMFTGLSTSVSAAIHESTEKSCCDECNEGEAETPDHCSTPNCPFFVCLSMSIDSPLILAVSFDGVYIPQANQKLVLKPFARSIFHPPESL